MVSLPNEKRSSKTIRIAAFGHRGVGKSTYLTALYAMLVNNTYQGVDFEYTDDDTAAKLAEYLNAVSETYSTASDWQLPATVSLPQELGFLLRRKGQEYNLELIDYRGESTTIGEMTQNKDLLDFFATCDGLMIFNANEADEENRTARRANYLARHQDLKYLFSSLKNRSGQQKLQIPVAMVYTKSDNIDFRGLSPEDWLEENNSAMLETLQNNVQTFRTVFLSSQMAFLNVMDNDRFRLPETQRGGNVVKCDTDVAYPLFWLIDQIQSPHQTSVAPASDRSAISQGWKIAATVILVVMVLGYFLFGRSVAPAAANTPSSFANTQLDAQQDLTGTVAGYPISLHIAKNGSYNCPGGISYIGWFYYNSQGKNQGIQLRGYSCGATFVLNEYEYEKHKGTFEGNIVGNEIKGVWRGGGKEVGFFLRKGK